MTATAAHAHDKGVDSDIVGKNDKELVVALTIGPGALSGDGW